VWLLTLESVWLLTLECVGALEVSVGCEAVLELVAELTG
jgi:hypothetical protein